jgi:hypothetical protein
MTSGSELAQLLARHRPTRAQTGYPKQVRARVGDYVIERRREGVMFDALADELGVSRTSLAHWARARRSAESGGFSALVVTPDPACETRGPAESGPGDRSPLQLVSPRGFSLQGLSLEQAIHALAVLR